MLAGLVGRKYPDDPLVFRVALLDNPAPIGQPFENTG